MSRTSTTPWRNRITGSGILKVSEAKPHALNFRLHPAAQSRALAASLDNVGWVQQVVVNTTTGNLLDGHLRVELARQRGESELPCLYVELSEDEERLVLATLDPIAAMATADRDKLAELLACIESEDEQAARPARADRPPGAYRAAGSGGWSTPTRSPSGPWSRSAARRPLASGRTTGSSVATPRRPSDVGRLMAGERALAMVTDPPYLVDYDGDNHPQSYANRAGDQGQALGRLHRP